MTDDFLTAAAHAGATFGATAKRGNTDVRTGRRRRARPGVVGQRRQGRDPRNQQEALL